MKISSERYHPRIENSTLLPFEPFISYEHWHRYCYCTPFVAGKVVLDIASGEGYGSAFLATHAATVYGVDVSEDAIAHARRAYVRENLHFLRGSAADIPIPGQHCFDVVVSFETIEHLDAHDQERFAREVKRLLKPDGVLLVSTPNRITYTNANNKNPYHINEFNIGEYKSFLKNFFKSAVLLVQHVYPVSYIWNLDGPPGPLAEYRMTFDDGAFRPGGGEHKEIGYLIAVCTDRDEVPASPDSLLVDLAEIAFQGIPDRDRWQTTTLFHDSGAGFRTEEMASELVEYTPKFSVTFTLDTPTAVRQLRWDPVEMRLCQVHLRQILWRDEAGLTYRLDLDRVTSNGIHQNNGAWRFETLDPMIFLPIAGTVASITIEGECLVEGETASLIGLNQVIWNRDHNLRIACEQLNAQNLQIARREADLEAVRTQFAAQKQATENYQRQLWVTMEQLQDRERLIQSCNLRLVELEGIRSHLEAMLQAILISKRWIFINWVRSVLYFVPNVLSGVLKRNAPGIGNRLMSRRRAI